MEETIAEFDPLSIDFDDIDFETYEDPDTGAVSYAKPEIDVVPETADQLTFQDEALDVTDLFSAADDDAVFSVGEYKLTKKQVAEIASKQSEIEAEHSFIQELASNLRQSEAHLRAIKAKSLSETDRHLQLIQSQLDDDSLTDAQRGAKLRELRQWQLRANDLNNDFSNAEAIIEGQRQEMLGRRIQDTDRAMLMKYGKDWQNQAADVYSFAIGHGVPHESISEVLCPALADLFVMARKWQAFETAQKAKAASEVKATIARSKKVSSHTTQRSQPVNEGKLSAFNEKANKGLLTREDLINSFDLIETFK